MTTAQQTIHYQLSAVADLDHLLSDMEEIDAGVVVVAFGGTSSFEPTELQLARLVAVARNFDKRLVIESGDRELANRAIRMGFNDLAVVSDSPVLEMKDTGTIAPIILTSEDLKQSFHRFTTTASLATYHPGFGNENGDLDSEEGNEASEEYDEPESTMTSSEANTVVFGPDLPDESGDAVAPDDQASRWIQAAPESVSPMDRWRNAQRQAIETEEPDDDYEDAENSHRAQRLRPRRKRRNRRSRAVILAAAIISPIIVLVVIAAMVAYMLPTAEISIVPNEETISSSLTYGVQTADARFDISIDPTVISNSSTAEATREATGERFEPDGTAAGVIQITNPYTSDVTVPAGTDISGSNGVVYYTSTDVVIPAADPFGTLSFGAASVDIYAGIAGPDGNLGAGSLTGQLGTGMFYTNPNDIWGGTLRSITVVTEDDLLAVEESVESALLAKAEREFLQTVPDGMELVPGSIEVQDPRIEVVGEAGEDGEQVSASGTITVRGQIFDPEELHERARAEAGRLLASQGGSERILLVSSVSIAEPTAIDDDGTSYSIRAHATVRTVITEEEKREIIEQLVGMNRESAEALLESHPKVSSYDLIIEPDWLPDRMPEISSRIDLHVSSGEQTTATR